MPAIELILDEDNLPKGVVRARDGCWKGEALICSRNTVELALPGETLDVSGVYVLSGIGCTDDAAPKDMLYIGSGDSVRDRLVSHLKHKLFWRTAIVFYRPNEPLHYGNIRYIEAKLIELANGKALSLENRNAPAIPKMPIGSRQESDQHVQYIVLYLRALGLDYFSPAVSEVDAEPRSATEAPSEDLADPLKIFSAAVRPLAASLQVVLEKFPRSEFYSTKTPDVRSKVVLDSGSRVFARIQPRKHGVRLQLRDLEFKQEISATEKNAIDRVRPLIQRSYERAVEILQSSS